MPDYTSGIIGFGLGSIIRVPCRRRLRDEAAWPDYMQYEVRHGEGLMLSWARDAGEDLADLE